jgi:actin related protein 2/3 complex subunit 5
VEKDKAAFNAAKNVAAGSVLSVLTAMDSRRPASAIKDLNDEERDALVKFIYRGFAAWKTITEGGKGQKSARVYDCNQLLKAHEEATEISGTVPINRPFTLDLKSELGLLSLLLP